MNDVRCSQQTTTARCPRCGVNTAVEPHRVQCPEVLAAARRPAAQEPVSGRGASVSVSPSPSSPPEDKRCAMCREVGAAYCSECALDVMPSSSPAPSAEGREPDDYALFERGDLVAMVRGLRARVSELEMYGRLDMRHMIEAGEKLVKLEKTAREFAFALEVICSRIRPDVQTIGGHESVAYQVLCKYPEFVRSQRVRALLSDTEGGSE